MPSTTQKDARLWWMVAGFLLLLCLTLLSPVLPQLPLIKAKSLSVSIMPLGDSITYGQGSSTGGGYRLPLWNELRADGFPVHFVGSVQTGPASFDRENEGLPGWKINQIAARVVFWLLAYRPHVILLHIGTNDFVKNDDPARAPARLSQLLALIATTLPDAVVIVAQIIPLPLSARYNAEVIAYNAAIPRIVQASAARGRHVYSVDMYHAVPPVLLPDRIHPDDAGYASMAKVWLSALLPLLQHGL